MSKFKEGDWVLDNHPECKEYRVGKIRFLMPAYYAVDFPQWPHPVRRLWNQVKPAFEVQDLMKEIL